VEFESTRASNQLLRNKRGGSRERNLSFAGQGPSIENEDLRRGPLIFWGGTEEKIELRKSEIIKGEGEGRERGQLSMPLCAGRLVARNTLVRRVSQWKNAADLLECGGRRVRGVGVRGVGA